MSEGSAFTGYTLLTGATGLVGSVLMRDMLSQGRRLAVLVRPNRRETAAERIESLLQYWESRWQRRLGRPVCLVGDVNADHFGLAESDQQWLRRRATRVIHSAAIVKFTGVSDQSEPWRTNLEGTRRALQLCRELGLREFHYVSTAYVCGRRAGVIREAELEMGQSFRNDYERSKYEAERIVRAADFIAPATIYRPVVIGGDSHTGYTNAYNGVYVYLRLLHVLMNNTRPDGEGRRYAPLRIALNGDERRNVVPVDWVTDAICRLLDNPYARGRTFHLAPRMPLSTRDFFAAAYRYFNAYGFEFRGRGWRPAGDATTFEEAFLAHRSPYEDYETSDPRFATSNLQRYAPDLPAPRIDEQVIHRYLSYGAQQRWGKRSLQKDSPNIRLDDARRLQLEADRSARFRQTEGETSLGLAAAG